MPFCEVMQFQVQIFIIIFFGQLFMQLWKIRFLSEMVLRRSQQRAQMKKFQRIFSPKQLLDFLKAAKEKLNIVRYTGVLLLAYTGLRRGEAQGWKWKDIDFENKKLTVDRTRDRFGARAPKRKTFVELFISDFFINLLKIINH